MEKRLSPGHSEIRKKHQTSKGDISNVGRKCDVLEIKEGGREYIMEEGVNPLCQMLL